jgi:hypothetical protein
MGTEPMVPRRRFHSSPAARTDRRGRIEPARQRLPFPFAFAPPVAAGALGAMVVPHSSRERPGDVKN